MAQVRREPAFTFTAFMGLVGLFLAHAVLAQGDGDVWTPRTPLQPPRRLLAAATYDGKIYTFGGCGSACFEPPLHTSTDEETRVQVYDPAEEDRGGNPWEEKPRMSAILFGAAAATVGDKIYTFGGFVTPALTQEYDPVSNSWRNRKPMPTPRHGLAAVEFEGKVYVLGGSDGKSPSGALEIYDPETNTWTPGPRMPTARVFLAAAEVGGKIFAIGGSPDPRGESATTVVEAYDVARKSWINPSPRPLPVALQTSAAAVVNDKIYVIGGLIPGTGVQHTTYEYDPEVDPAINPAADPAGNPWPMKEPMPTARDQAPAAVVNGDIYVLAGAVDCHCTALGANEKYTPPHGPVKPEGCLSITKTDHRNAVCPGDALTYEISVRNDQDQGLGPVNGVTVFDDFSSISQLQKPVSWTCTASGGASCSSSRGPTLRDEVNLPPDGEVRYLVTAIVRDGASGNIENEVRVTPPLEVTGSSCTHTKTDTTRVQVTGDPAISVAGSTAVHQTETATYSVVVTHTGAAISGVVRVTIIGGKALPSPPCVVDPGIDPKGFTCDLGSFSAGSPPVPLVLKVEPTQGCPCPSQIVLDASVTATEKECNEDNNDTASATTAVKCEADLAIDKSAPEFVKKNESISYVLKIINKGPDYACGVKVKDSHIDDIGISKHPRDCELKPADGGICPGGSFEAMYSLAQGEPCGAKISNTANITADTDDPDTANNSDMVMTTVVCPPVSRCFVPPVLRLKE